MLGRSNCHDTNYSLTRCDEFHANCRKPRCQKKTNRVMHNLTISLGITTLRKAHVFRLVRLITRSLGRQAPDLSVIGVGHSKPGPTLQVQAADEGILNQDPEVCREAPQSSTTCFSAHFLLSTRNIGRLRNETLRNTYRGKFNPTSLSSRNKDAQGEACAYKRSSNSPYASRPAR